MQYSDLIQFKNLESVIQFRHAEQSSKAKRLVQTYVISDEMADKLIKLVFEQLGFDLEGDKKGLFIVGNYGTGKSHLMAVISSIAEQTKLVNYLTNKTVAESAKKTIAGQFQVIRVELSAVKRSLRDCLTEEIEQYLDRLGVSFQFPPADKITNNKGAFEDMMAAFEKHYSGQGLLLIVDELLEFLSSRKSRELIVDLSFLREIGEICQNTRFRFIAGMQETIFDNPRFKFAANELRRVKDRFEQLLITRKDIKFVVAERLLKKKVAQKKKIRAYLQPFAHCYGSMNERLDEFVDLFPVHPDYINVFEQIIAVEKREILKQLEGTMQELLNQTVPENQPNLLAFDSYWNTLRENFSLRATDDIREVINCSQVLEDRIERAFTRPNYKAMALRIIHALSVHRLTTHDFSAAVGMTAQELRDTLCLYQPGIEELGNPAADLHSQVELVLREILKTVNRQFISANTNNGQYYLDLKKTEDFDAIIENRAEMVEADNLDDYYYVVLRQIMEATDEPYVGNFLIWQRELEWRCHKVTRLGYLIFGCFATPNERATAVPERDFYLYFLQPYETPKYQKSAATSDEVFFNLKHKDETFHQLLRNYTAASILVRHSSGHPKSVYENKAQLYFKQVAAWLQNNITKVFEVTYQGKTQPLLDWTKSQNIRELAGLGKEERINFRELIELVASICLEQTFTDKSPEYPVFSRLITGDNLAQAAQEAIRGLLAAPNKRSKQANTILDALQLLDGPNITPLNSPYACYIIDLLNKKAKSQVLNYGELLPDSYLAPEKYRLEPEFVMVILAALIYSGELVLAMPGKKFNASNFNELAGAPLKDWLTFKHLERPKDFNVPALKALFELFGLPTDLAIDLTQNKPEAVQQLHTFAHKHLESVVKTQNDLGKAILFWGKAVLSTAEMQHYQKRLADCKAFLETLQAYSTPGQFKNFRYSLDKVTAQRSGFETLQELNQLQSILRELNTATAYLMAAEAMLPPEHDWVQDMKATRAELLPRMKDSSQRASSGFSYHIQQQLGILQKNYRQLYLDLHQQARLGAAEHEDKKKLLRDARLTQLKQLAPIDLMPQQQLDDFETRLNQLQTCFDLSEYDLFAQAFCPHCEFKPTSPPPPPAVDRLTELSDTLAQRHSEWTQTLLTELNSVAKSERWQLLQAENRARLEIFLSNQTLPEQISYEFLEAVQEALSGLHKVTLNLTEFQNAIVAGSFPATLPELQQRIDNYLQELTLGKKTHKIRIVLGGT